MLREGITEPVEHRGTRWNTVEQDEKIAPSEEFMEGREIVLQPEEREIEIERKSNFLLRLLTLFFFIRFSGN